MSAKKLTQEHEFDPLVDELPSRYVVGLDLGTTNSAVAYVDTEAPTWEVTVFPIPQLVAAGEVEPRETLPSFHYQATASQAAEGILRLPWNGTEACPSTAVGVFARDEGTRAPGRVIASAKSWLCHPGVDRTADLLPWQGTADVDRLSPVEVTARYLRHIRDAWNAAFRDAPLQEQQLVITLPASFDEVARELTIQAAAAAKLPRVVLIEEPQAAFYAWVHRHADDWQEQVEPGQKILVCDIGGGTTDFTLIHARAAESGDGSVQFHRAAVGNHLILGGDNLDLAVARHLESRLAGNGKLSPQQWDVLVRSSRRAKETLLGDHAPPAVTLHLPGAGAQVIGGGVNVELQCDELQELLIEGFLPRVSLTEKPAPRRSGFQEFGLPYAPDHAITRYLASFLRAHCRPGEASADTGSASARPDIVLFNGGFFASSILRERLLEVLASWFQDEQPDWQPLVLDNDRLDLAVARGAAYYGMVQRGEGVRIAANLARSYYIGVEQQAGDEPTAVCLIPGDAEPGREIELSEMPFQLRISEPVEFPLFVSSTRLSDLPGKIITLDPEQTTPLPPIRTVLHTGRRKERGSVPVHLHARLTEIGTIELWCGEVGGDRTWKLQFDIRSTIQTDMEAHVAGSEQQGFLDEDQLSAARDCIAAVFGAEGTAEPARLVKQLARALDADRHQWPTSLLRRMWEWLMEFEPGRRRSPAHQTRWLNLLGFALRPGYGFALDDWRVAETWRTVRDKLAFPAAEQDLILWRRIAGGLSQGQQQAIAEPTLAAIRALHHRFQGGGQKRAADPAVASVEMWRLLGSLELLPVPLKIEIGETITELLPKRKLEKFRDAMVWSLGRLGQRMPLYGPLNTVIPKERAAKWLDAVISVGSGPTTFLAAMELARRTEDRHRDLDEARREAAASWLEQQEGPPHLAALIREGGQLDQEEQGQVFGETLPRGLRIL